LNPVFVPEKDVIKKIDQVLSKWGLNTGIPEVYNLTNGENSVVTTALDNLNFEGGLAVEYPGADGKLVSTIMGESYYRDEVADEGRYIERLTLIVGIDYRIHPSNQELSLTVKKPPLGNFAPIEPYCEYDEFLHYGQHAEAYTSTLFTTPPVIDIWAADKKRIIGEQNFLGFWRTAFIIDCGKDLPKLGDEVYKIPNQEFIIDFENALGSKVIEIGEVY
jgi:hypothetical protein